MHVHIAVVTLVCWAWRYTWIRFGKLFEATYFAPRVVCGQLSEQCNIFRRWRSCSTSLAASACGSPSSDVHLVLFQTV